MAVGDAGAKIAPQDLRGNHRGDNERRVFAQQRVIRGDHGGQPAEHGYPYIPADISHPEAVSQKAAEKSAGGA